MRSPLRTALGTVLIVGVTTAVASAQLQKFNDLCADAFTNAGSDEVMTDWIEMLARGPAYDLRRNTSQNHCGATNSVQEVTWNNVFQVAQDVGAIFRDFGDMVPGHKYTLRAWFWIDNAANNAFNVNGGLGVQVAANTNGLTAQHFWFDASSIPGIGGDVGGDGFAHTNCWPESGQAACQVDKTWFSRTLTWTQPAGMTAARIMIGWETRFSEDHLVLIDDISFTDDSVVVADPPVLASAVSRRVHGGNGTFDIDVPLSGFAVEPRQNGQTGSQTVLTFDKAVEATDGAPNCGQEIIVTGGTCTGVTISGAEVRVDMTFNKNACVRVAASGIRAAGGGPAMTGDNDVLILTHEGNVNQVTGVNILDLQAIKNVLNAPLAAGNFMNDVTVSGSINILDLQACKNNLLQGATCN